MKKRFPSGVMNTSFFGVSANSEYFGGFDDGDGRAELFANFVGDIVNVCRVGIAFQNRQQAERSAQPGHWGSDSMRVRAREIGWPGAGGGSGGWSGRVSLVMVSWMIVTSF